MSEKISQVPEATSLAPTDLFALAKDTGLGPTGFSSQHVTVATLIDQLGTDTNLYTNETFLSETTVENLLTRIDTTDVIEGDNLYYTQGRIRTIVEEEAGAYVLELADAEIKWKTITSASPVNCTVPPQTDVDWPVDTYIEFMQGGNGAVTLVPGSGVTLIVNENLTLVGNGLYAVFGIKRLEEDVWVAFGNLVQL
jgi:hypothetical protein